MLQNEVSAKVSFVHSRKAQPFLGLVSFLIVSTIGLTIYSFASKENSQSIEIDIGTMSGMCLCLLALAYGGYLMDKKKCEAKIRNLPLDWNFKTLILRLNASKNLSLDMKPNTTLKNIFFQLNQLKQQIIQLASIFDCLDKKKVGHHSSDPKQRLFVKTKTPGPRNIILSYLFTDGPKQEDSPVPDKKEATILLKP